MKKKVKKKPSLSLVNFKASKAECESMKREAKKVTEGVVSKYLRLLINHPEWIRIPKAHRRAA